MWQSVRFWLFKRLDKALVGNRGVEILKKAVIGGSEEAITEIKAQFIADAILPSIGKQHAKALATELPRKNSKEYDALDAGQRDTWEYVNQAKKDARATLNTYFSRIVRYAFPKEATESETTSLKTKIQTQIADLIKKCEKATDADFDLVATRQALNAVLTLVNKWFAPDGISPLRWAFSLSQFSVPIFSW